MKPMASAGMVEWTVMHIAHVFFISLFLHVKKKLSSPYDRSAVLAVGKRTLQPDHPVKNERVLVTKELHFVCRICSRFLEHILYMY